MNKNLHTTDAFGRAAGNGRPELEARDKKGLGRAQKRYERYFIGYSERRETDENGKRGRIVREYTGKLYRQQLPPEQVKRVRLRFALLTLAAVSVYIAAVLLPAPGNSIWYSALLALVPAVFYVQLLFAARLYVFSKQDLKMREYRDAVLALPRIAALLVCSVLAAYAGAAYILITIPATRSFSELIRLLLLAGSCAVALLLNRAESRIDYMVLPGVGQSDGDSVFFDEEGAAAVRSVDVNDEP